MANDGSDRNYDLGRANEAFKQFAGRDLNQTEINWLNTRGDVGKRGHDAAAADLGRGYSAMTQNIVSDAKNVYGLDLSLQEANKLRDSLYIAGDQRSHDTFYDRMNAALANKKTEALTNPQVKPEQQAQFGDTVKSLFQEYLGRDPKQYELDHFSKQLAQGDDPYLLANALQQAPEYLDKQAETQRAKIGQELLGYQQEAFKRAQPSIVGAYMRAGRLNSTGLDAHLANAQADLERQRQATLTGYSREDYLSGRARAFDVFSQNQAPSAQRTADLTAMRYQQPFASGRDVLARGNELADYARQQNDFNRYLQMQKDAQRSASRYGLYGQILGAGMQAGATYAGMKGSAPRYDY